MTITIRSHAMPDFTVTDMSVAMKVMASAGVTMFIAIRNGVAFHCTVN